MFKIFLQLSAYTCSLVSSLTMPLTPPKYDIHSRPPGSPSAMQPDDTASSGLTVQDSEVGSNRAARLPQFQMRRLLIHQLNARILPLRIFKLLNLFGQLAPDEYECQDVDSD